jgi:lysozyme
MSDMERLVADTRVDEGYKPKPYKDTRGLWTFGEGRCLETHPLTGAEWKTLLDRAYLDVAIAVPGADLLERTELAAVEVRLAHDYDFWPRLNAPRQNALIEMAYQMGADKEEAFHQMVTAIREERWADAEAAGLDSLWAKQTPARAAKVMRQLRTGEFPS